MAIVTLSLLLCLHRQSWQLASVSLILQVRQLTIATCWTADDCHSTDIILSEPQRALIRRTVDSTVYYVEISWSGKAVLSQTGKNRLKLTPSDKQWNFNVGFYKHQPVVPQPDYKANLLSANRCWRDYWQTSGVIDFLPVRIPRASLLERRVVLSLIFAPFAGSAKITSQAETYLTYNTWYGKFHLEMGNVAQFFIMRFGIKQIFWRNN